MCAHMCVLGGREHQCVSESKETALSRNLSQEPYKQRDRKGKERDRGRVRGLEKEFK